MDKKEFYNDLVKKYFKGTVIKICQDVYNKKFETFFDENTQVKDSNDTTINTTFNQIQKIAEDEIKDFIFSDYVKISLQQTSTSDNLFHYIIYDLLCDFNEGFSVENIVDDIFFDLQDKCYKNLFSCGVVDINGDYIEKKELKPFLCTGSYRVICEGIIWAESQEKAQDYYENIGSDMSPEIFYEQSEGLDFDYCEEISEQETKKYDTEFPKFKKCEKIN